MNGPRERHRAQALDVRVHEHMGVPLIVLRGELDAGSVKHLYHALDDALQTGSDVLLLDLSALGYVDSAGLNVIFDTTRTLRHRGCVGAIAPNRVVYKLLEMAGLIHHPCFRLFEDLDSVTLD